MTLDRDLIEAVLPAYEVEGELGRGGWGIVLAGRHRQLGREVAIKQLPRAFGADTWVRGRFIAEALVLASLDHPHIVPVYDFIEEDGLCLLVMEKLTGGTVWNRFTSDGLTMDAACAVVLAACDALQCAHGRGVLHRDIKPENLLFSGASVLKVVDFGIAKVIGGPRTLATRAGEVLGTPEYMAPEQAQGATLTAATDVYAAGTMLYELLSGQLPFPEGGDAMAVLYRHVYEAPTPLADVAPNVPGEITQVVMRAIATDPDDRFSSAEAFGVALAEAATTAWNPGWLGRGGFPVMAASSIVAATERPSDQLRPAAASTAAEPAAAAPVRRAAPTELTDPVGKGNAPAAPPTEPPEPVPVPAPPPRVRPTVTIHSPRPVLDDTEQLDLVPVAEVLRPAAPIVPVLVALALLLLAVAVAFAGASPGYERSAGFSVSVNGTDVGAADGVELDLSEPVQVAGTLPEGASPAGRVVLRFSLLGVPLSSASGAVAPEGERSFTASVDASGARYLVAGEVTGEVEVADQTGAAIATASFPATSTQPALLTAPGLAAVVLLLFLLSYAGSLLRWRRKGKKAVTATVGMVLIGALGGVAAIVVAWILAGQQPVVATVVVCAVLGAGSGAAAAVAATRIGQRRRFQAKKPSRRPARPSV